MPGLFGPVVWFASCSLVCLASVAAESPKRWLIHDMQRPRPAVVTPGKQALPVPPPSGAVVVFEGADLSSGEMPKADRPNGEFAMDTWNPSRTVATSSQPTSLGMRNSISNGPRRSLPVVVVKAAAIAASF